MMYESGRAKQRRNNPKGTHQMFLSDKKHIPRLQKPPSPFIMWEEEDSSCPPPTVFYQTKNKTHHSILGHSHSPKPTCGNTYFPVA